MKKNITGHRQRNSVILVVCSVVLIIAALAILEKTGVTNFIHANSNGSSEISGPSKAEEAQQTKDSASQKQQYLDGTKSDPVASGSNTSSASSATSLTLSASQDNNTVTVLTKIQGVSEGTCSLTITNGTNVSSQTAQIIYQPEFSSCAGFSVITSTLGKGSWNISLSVNSAGGSTLTKSLVLEVR